MSHTKRVPCDICDGTGKVPDHDLGKIVGNQWIVEELKDCWSCGGRGEVEIDPPKEPTEEPPHE